MEENRLQMNNNKTEFIFFGTRHQLDKCSTTAISACNVSVPVSKQVKYLGVYLDSELSLNTHVMKKCQVAMMNVRRLRNIRYALTIDTAKILASALILPQTMPMPFYMGYLRKH